MTLLTGVDEQATPTVNVGAWVMRISCAFIFVALGYVKIFPSDGSMWFRYFDTIGWGRWFMTLTGVLQLAGGLLFLIPRTVLLAGLVTGATMAGAVVAQVAVLEGAGAAIIPGALLAFVIGATIAGRPD